MPASEGFLDDGWRPPGSIGGNEGDLLLRSGKTDSFFGQHGTQSLAGFQEHLELFGLASRRD